MEKLIFDTIGKVSEQHKDIENSELVAVANLAFIEGLIEPRLHYLEERLLQLKNPICKSLVLKKYAKVMLDRIKEIFSQSSGDVFFTYYAKHFNEANCEALIVKKLKKVWNKILAERTGAAQAILDELKGRLCEALQQNKLMISQTIWHAGDDLLPDLYQFNSGIRDQDIADAAPLIAVKQGGTALHE